MSPAAMVHPQVQVALHAIPRGSQKLGAELPKQQRKQKLQIMGNYNLFQLCLLKYLTPPQLQLLTNVFAVPDS